MKHVIKLDADYLIVGSGAVGMAFTDTLISETDARIVMVDRYPKPGGHWNVAYPFVTLHQPSQFYGVSSKELSNGIKDKTGLNEGLCSLATGIEVSAYFDDVMRHTFLRSGRVQYFPSCDYKGLHRFESMISGQKYEVKVHKKLVDASYLNTSVPSTHTPGFTVGEGVAFMPLNELPKIKTPPAGYVVVGGGKTGIDACLWLMENKVNPDSITWIVSRDAWLLDRRNTQPTEEFFEYAMGAQAAQLKSIAEADSIEDMFDRLEDAGVLVRIDRTIKPKMFHGATISRLELEALQEIKNVIRLGRVQRIEPDKIVLDHGVIPTSSDHLHVDCSASAIPNLQMKTIFEDGLITPQTVRSYQPVFSAAFIAHVEAHYQDDKTKNKLCQVVPLPNHDTDWIPMTAAQMMNQFTWSQDKELRHWLRNNRLDGFSKMVSEVDRSDPVKMDILKSMRDYAMPAAIKLQQFISELQNENREVMKHPQMQVRKEVFFNSRLVEIPGSELELDDGEVLVRVEKFAYSANNITYAVAGELIGYWQFFPAAGNDAGGWGVIPVWGFGKVVDSKVADIAAGERWFGYFPPAQEVKMRPVGVKENRLIDGSPHRAHLPMGYNRYRRVQYETGYDPAYDNQRMLLFPLYLTSFCLWDTLKDNKWYGARRVIILSASSKTGIGLGYAIEADDDAPAVVGFTSLRNLEMVQDLGIYHESLTYERIAEIDPQIPTVVVDMSGNTRVMSALQNHLGDHRKYTINVGLTHWPKARPANDRDSSRSEFFFAPGHIQKRIKEWGASKFDRKSSTFLMETAAKTSQWLSFKKVDGLEGLSAVHSQVCEGMIPADHGLIVEM